MKKLFSIIVLLVIVFSGSICMANSAAVDASKQPLFGFIDNIGVDWQYGRDYMLPDTLRGEHCVNTVNRVVVRAESRRLIFSDKWGIQGEFHYSAHKADEVPDHGQDTGFKEFGVNLALIRHFLDDMFYVGLRAGLSYIPEFPEFENRDWPDRCLEANVGRSHCFGTWGPMVGKNWKIKGNPWSVRTEMGITHSSDPLRTDSGRNFAHMSLGLTYSF